MTNSIGFKNAVNATNLCGSGAWRLPTKDELLGIVKTTEDPKIDNVWFPNAVAKFYWTSSTLSFPGYPFGAYSVYFYNGRFYYDVRDLSYGNGYLVRLVR